MGVARWQPRPSSLAFSMCILATVIEMVGPQFCSPVLTPYGSSMAFSKFEIGTLFTASAAGAVISSFLLPALSDKKGRKPVVILSSAGIAAAYFLQGTAHVWEFPLNYMAILTGRGVSGLLGGIGTVLAAYLIEISNSDYDQLKRRMTIISGVQQLSGIVFGPLAGFIATFGLSIPFLAAASTALVGTPILALFFTSPDVVKRQEGAQDPVLAEHRVARRSASPRASRTSSAPRAQRPFWQDVVMITYMLSYVCIGFLSVAITPLLTFLIQHPSYGLLRDDAQQTQEVVAQATSLLMLPQKLMDLGTMLFVSPILSVWLGDTLCGIVGVVALSMGTAGLALLAELGDGGLACREAVERLAGILEPCGNSAFPGRIWMVCLCMGCHGFGDGMLIPFLLGSAPKYRGEMYPDRLGGAGAFVSRGIFVGLMLGVPVSLSVAEAFSLGKAWLLLVAAGMLFYILLVVADILGQAKVSALHVTHSAELQREDTQDCTLSVGSGLQMMSVSFNG